MELVIVGLAVLLVVAVFAANDFRDQRNQARKDHKSFQEKMEAHIKEFEEAVGRDSLKIQSLNEEKRDLINTIEDMKQITNKDREQIIDLEDNNKIANEAIKVRDNANNLLSKKVEEHSSKIVLLTKHSEMDKAMIGRLERMVQYERERVKRAQKKNRELRNTSKPKSKGKKK